MARDGERIDDDDVEMVDLVEEEVDAEEEEEVEEQEASEDGGSEDEDEVTETNEAQSEEGKEPVFHHEIYDRLVKLMSSQGAYTHDLPDHGIDSMDITSFHPDQRDWASSRVHWPTILTLWAEPPGPRPTYPIDYLLFNGHLILDYAGTPIRAFRNLPLTISSAVKGFRLEAWMRQDLKRLHFTDILARLRTRNTPSGRVPLHKHGDFTDRAHFFRMKAGLVTFRPQNSALRVAARSYMDSLRTPAQRAGNLAIDQDLTPDQLATLKEISRGGRTNVAAGPGASAPARVPARVPAPAPTPSPTVTPHFQPSQRQRQHAAPPPATPPTPAPMQNLPDSRDAVPSTCKESYTLIAALEETVQHFKKLTGQPPKHTNTAQSYSAQWNALQAQFSPIWRSQRPTEEIPLLFKLCKWTGGIGCWDDDWRTKVGGEERDGEGERFGEYTDAAMEGTAYLGPGGGWRSVRDTWCNSHVNDPARTHPRRRRRLRPTRGTHHPRDRTDLIGEEGSEEIPRDGSAGNLEAGSKMDCDKSSDESFVEEFEEEDSDDDFRGEE